MSPRRGRRAALHLTAMALVHVLVLVAVGCGGGSTDPGPAELGFDSQITFRTSDGSAGGALGGEAATAGDGGVIVGHVIGASIGARSGPSTGAEVVAELDNPTEVGGPLVFQLVENDLARAVTADGWVEVHLPVRPNGSTGWVPLGRLELSRNPFRIAIDAGDHRLEVWRDGERWLETTVAIGTGATPTPRGRFYVIELLQPPDPTGLYGPFAFGLSGFSETLQSFAGGDGVIGIHGTDEPEALGTDVSHGCVRVDNEIITAMAGFIPLGTPVVITG